MSNDRDKLVEILNELEKDYRVGNISKEKYVNLRERYIYKIKTIDTSNRIRSIQDRKNYSPNPQANGRNPRSNQNRQEHNKNKNSRNHNSPRKYCNKNNEFQKFQEDSLGRSHNRKPIKDFNYFSRVSSNSNNQDKSKKSGTMTIGALFSIVLLIAFCSGIVMGIFNIDANRNANDISELISSGASINDTAFPIIKHDISPNYNSSTNYYKSNTNYYSDSDYNGSSNYVSVSGSSSDSESINQ